MVLSTLLNLSEPISKPHIYKHIGENAYRFGDFMKPLMHSYCSNMEEAATIVVYRQLSRPIRSRCAQPGGATSYH